MKKNLHDRVSTLLDADKIAAKVAELGARITADFEGKDLTALVVLKGSFVFAADLLRQVNLPLTVEFIGLRSYGSRKTTSGVVEITHDVKFPLNGKHVLVIEDIVDSGLTLDYLMNNLATRQPASLKLASLLHKPARTLKEVPIDYLGFTVPDSFVVGYGLDFDGVYRNLPYVGVLEEEQIDLPLTK